jgi:hypothetical protein
MWNRIITEKGSCYSQIGCSRKTQRYKMVTKETCPVMDMLVFVNFTCRAELQTALQVIHSHGSGLKLYVIDKDGKILDKVSPGTDISLVTVDKSFNTVSIFETSTSPQLGWCTFDQRRYVKKGVSYREIHIGNKIISIE